MAGVAGNVVTVNVLLRIMLILDATIIDGMSHVNTERLTGVK